MRKILVLICVVLFAQAVSASPLVFKTTKAISTTDSFTELFTLDTSKFRDLRVHIVGSEPRFDMVLRAIEGDDELLLFPQSATMFSVNFLLPAPPTKLRVLIQGKGTFKAFVWGH